MTITPAKVADLAVKAESKLYHYDWPLKTIAAPDMANLIAKQAAEIERLREALQEIADTSLANPRNVEGAAGYMQDAAVTALQEQNT